VRKHFNSLNLIIIFSIFFSTETVFAQLGFCQGNSGDPIFEETFGAGTGYGPQLAAGISTYAFVGFNGPQDGEYTVGSNTFAYGWNMPSDHTPGDTNGKALLVNASFTTGEFYTIPINGLCENTTYEFSSWLLNILPSSGCGGNGIPVNVRFQIWDVTNTNLLATGDTGNIFSSGTPNWQQYGLVFQTVPGQTAVILKMINNGSGGCGNDLAIDDIVFKSCGDFIDVTNSDGNNSDDDCITSTPYSTILTAIPDNTVFSSHFYQWQESIDAIFWTDLPDEINDTLAVSGVITTSYYRVKVAEFASNLSNNDCNTFSNVFEIIITQAPTQPTLECWEIATINDVTCSWEVTGTQPTQPTGLECWETTSFNLTTCSWDITGTQTTQPTIECWETATFNTTACSWEVTGNQPIQPVGLECWEITNFNTTTCSWDITGTEPTQPTIECWETTTLNSTTCLWEVTGTQPIQPTGLECWEVTNFNTITCSWDLTGTQPTQPTIECWEIAIFNTATCSWDITGTQPIQPTLACYETTTFNTTTCNWDVTGTQPLEPTDLECWEMTTFDDITCTWDISGTEPVTGNVPAPLVYCDLDSDGFGVFTLTDLDDAITGGDPNLTVSYHETVADANNDVNPLLSPYNNIVQNQQIIYVRVDSAAVVVDCVLSLELILIVNPTPQLGASPTTLEVCDDVTADGIAQFDLTSKNDEILQNLVDSTLYTVSFYADEVNADAATNPIATPTNYTNTTAFNQELWVRVEDNAISCYKLTTLDLVVNALPVLLQPLPLELCDDNNPGDQMEVFLLEDATDEILDGQTGISLTYFETQVDADTNTDPIASPYTNIVNPQTVFVVATNDETGCSVSTTATLLLRVNPLPSPTTPTDLEACDEDNDGFASFDLEERTLEIIGGELNIAVTYHDTQADAETGDNTLASPYTNIVMDQQTIYIRLTNTITGCYNASETLTIRVLASPEVPVTIDEYVICDTNSDGIAQFDLTTKDAEVIGTQTDVTLTYHVTAADAASGANPIANVGNYSNTSNPQTIYVSLVSTINACVDLGQFEIRVELPPVAVQPLPLELCDDEIEDEITVFDLTVKDAEITGGEASWSVSYYETQVDADAQTNAVTAEAYTNTAIGIAAANPQTLFVVVTDIDTGCADQVTLTIRVLPNPTPTEVLPDLILCDDINPGDMEEVFDLTTDEALLLNGELNVTPTYHETLEAAEEGVNAIPDSTLYTNTSTPQVIHVRVTNDNTGCYTIVNFTIIVNPLPDVIAVTDFIACELFNDGFYDFDLTMKDAEVLNGQDPLLFTVTYYETQEDADDLVNALVSLYTNITDPQQIFVAITNTDTGCSISTPSFNIDVQEAAEANSDMEAILYEICDDEMDDDNDPTNNSAQFDLTLVAVAADLDPDSIQAQILDGQDPANYILSYYASEVDAELGVNPLPLLYENLETPPMNPQVIWGRVDNNTLDISGLDTSICYAVAPLTLQVNPLPVFDLEDSYILCVGLNGTEVLAPLVLDTNLSTPTYTFEWLLNGTAIVGATEGSYMPIEGGTYTITVTDVTTSTETSCPSSAMTEVIESAPPTVEATVSTDAFSDTHVIEVTVDGLGDYEYSLDGGPWQDEPLFVDVSLGEHFVTARDKIGCGEASDAITVMDYPKFFTPNGDGFNDTWNISAINGQPNAKIYIFDRYGKLLKQLSPTGAGWNGTYNGNQLPISDYWFVIEYNEPNTGDRKEFKAHFTLKR
jgi:gliding motility-associated-like protein